MKFRMKSLFLSKIQEGFFLQNDNLFNFTRFYWFGQALYDWNLGMAYDKTNQRIVKYKITGE